MTRCRSILSLEERRQLHARTAVEETVATAEAAALLGNQPQMRASGTLEGKQASFKFVHATNMKSPNDPHMHSVTYTFVDEDTLKAEWTMFQDGKPNGAATFELHRKK